METKNKKSDADIYQKVGETIASIITESNEEKKILRLCVIHLKKYGCDALKDAIKRWEDSNSPEQIQEGKVYVNFEEEYTNYAWYTDIMYHWKDKLRKLELAKEFAEKYDQLQEPKDKDVKFIINWFLQRVA